MTYNRDMYSTPATMDRQEEDRIVTQLEQKRKQLKINTIAQETKLFES